jgi:hypothetical protein
VTRVRVVCAAVHPSAVLIGIFKILGVPGWPGCPPKCAKCCAEWCQPKKWMFTWSAASDLGIAVSLMTVYMTLTCVSPES